MENKRRENLKKVLENYKEYDLVRDQFEEIINCNSIPAFRIKRIIKKIVIDDGYGQDLTETEILKNLHDKEKIRYLLNRLFIENIEIEAADKFIEKVKNGKIKIDKFLDLHKKQPCLNYWQKILLNYWMCSKPSKVV